MFCPQCGSTQNDDLRFCKLCGANLQAVRQVMVLKEGEEQRFDWSNTWVAEMFMSEAERKRREQELQRQQGITPEIKRYDEIKAGVITSSVGIAVMLFLNMLAPGIIAAGHLQQGEDVLIRNIWGVGIIPFLVGLAIIFNGLVVSKRAIKLQERSLRATNQATAVEAGARSADQLPPANTSEIVPTSFSVTEHTTQHLGNPRK
jgi:hypothetical protein